MNLYNKNIIITDSYLESIFKLDKSLRKLTFTAVKTLSDNYKNNSLQIHKIDRLKCDPKFRSARVNDNLRIIFAAENKNYTLLYVDHHDDAYKWCEGKFIQRTDFGAKYIYDENAVYQKMEDDSKRDYFDFEIKQPLMSGLNIKVKNLMKLGINEIHSENLLKISHEDRFIDYISIFPGEIAEALLDIALNNKTFDEVYLELIDNNYNKEIDNDVQQKDSRRRFYVPESLEELEILMENDDFEKWRLFLHPSQEYLVKRQFNGPALIEGGPGTGKTIVGIHRAVYLSKHIYKWNDNKKILFCTFSKKLSVMISSKINDLLHQRMLNSNIDVINVDSIINKILTDTYGYQNRVDMKKFDMLFVETYKQISPKESIQFYKNEYSQIIERQGIRNIYDYLNVDRTGAGIPLDKKKRVEIWIFFNNLFKEKEKLKIDSFIDRAYKLLHGIDNGDIVPMYDSIIIDEAQDLESVKLKALCKLVRTKENNIFILSDINQRIFKLNTWKKDVDINVVGRTHYLSINYRTTKQINDYARHQFVNSEMIKDHIKEYKSIFNGYDPEIIGFQSETTQYKYITNKLNELLSLGRKSQQICIITPNYLECKKIESILLYEEISNTVLVGDTIPEVDSGICICPIQGVKGLEFEVVIMFNYNKIGIEVFDFNESDAFRVDYNKLIECKKYVAITRARDELIVTYLEEGAI